MNIGETTLSFLQEDCVREFGEKDGERLFHLAEQEYQRLLCAADYRNSGAVHEHLQKKPFPPMAYYKALCEEKFPRCGLGDGVGLLQWPRDPFQPPPLHLLGSRKAVRLSGIVLRLL